MTPSSSESSKIFFQSSLMLVSLPYQGWLQDGELLDGDPVHVDDGSVDGADDGLGRVTGGAGLQVVTLGRCP